MVLKVYGYTQSAATKLVAGVLREKNIPYKLVLVDMSLGEHKSPEHLEKQPFGQVPYIVIVLSLPETLIELHLITPRMTMGLPFTKPAPSLATLKINITTKVQSSSLMI